MYAKYTWLHCTICIDCLRKISVNSIISEMRTVSYSTIYTLWNRLFQFFMWTCFLLVIVIVFIYSIMVVNNLYPTHCKWLQWNMKVLSYWQYRHKDYLTWHQIYDSSYRFSNYPTTSIWFRRSYVRICFLSFHLYSQWVKDIWIFKLFNLYLT